MNDVSEIVDKLKYQGIKIVSSSSISEMEDAEIQLEGEFHVQVGEDYLMLVQQVGSEFTFHEVADNSVGELIRMITTT